MSSGQDSELHIWNTQARLHTNIEFTGQLHYIRAMRTKVHITP